MTRKGRKKGPPPLPGDCVSIPHVRAEVRDASGHIGWVAETHVVPGLDLDGSGSPIVLVPPEGVEPNVFSMWWRLFIQRGDCGHELGIVIGAGDPVPEPGESHGLRNFSALQSVSAQAGGQGIGVTVYAFDGVRYVGGRTEYQ